MKKLINERGVRARDPQVIKHNGKFYHCFTEDLKSVSVSCADTLEGLDNAEKIKVFVPDCDEYSSENWAPELHVIDNKCYIYVAADNGSNYNHRMYVLENNSDDPQKPYKMHGKIMEKSDKWAIDGTVMTYNNEHYFIWAGWEGDRDVRQNLYIAKMKNPFELEGERVLISTPELTWELNGSTDESEEGYPYINEGAYAFVMNGVQYLTYSASGSWCDDYCIAVLELVGDNPLNPQCWKKHPEPVLSGNDVVKGAGHCSVVEDEGTYNVIFHAWEKDEQQVTWGTVYVWHGVLEKNDNGFVIN